MLVFECIRISLNRLECISFLRLTYCHNSFLYYHFCCICSISYPLEFPYFYPHSPAFTGFAINNFKKCQKYKESYSFLSRLNVRLTEKPLNESTSKTLNFFIFFVFFPEPNDKVSIDLSHTPCFSPIYSAILLALLPPAVPPASIRSSQCFNKILTNVISYSFSSASVSDQRFTSLPTIHSFVPSPIPYINSH